VGSVLINPAKFGEGRIAAFGPYKPWSWHKAEGGDGSNYPQYSGRILDLKDGKGAAVAYFRDLIAPELAERIVVVVVPSHDSRAAWHGFEDVGHRAREEGHSG